MSTSPRAEIVRLLAAVIWRMHRPTSSREILPPQNPSHSAQSTLPVSSTTLQQCHHDNPVNNHREQGEA